MDGCEDSIRHFWVESGLSPFRKFYPDPTGLCRCRLSTMCGKTYTYKRPQDLKAHNTSEKHFVTKIKKTLKTAVETAKQKREKNSRNCYHEENKSDCVRNV